MVVKGNGELKEGHTANLLQVLRGEVTDISDPQGIGHHHEVLGGREGDFQLICCQ